MKSVLLVGMALCLLFVVAAQATVYTIDPVTASPTPKPIEAEVAAPQFGAITLPFHAVALNDNGVVVGYRFTGENDWIGPKEIVSWQNGQMIVIGTFDGYSAEPIDINNEGVMLISRQAEQDPSSKVEDYLVLPNGDLKKIVVNDGPKIEYQEPRHLNNLGQVTVACGGTSHSAIWTQDYQVLIQSEDNRLYLDGINNKGQAVGNAFDDSSGHHFPFIWDNGIRPLELPNIQDSSTFAASLNDYGLVVGSMSQPNSYLGGHPLDYPVAWVHGNFTKLATGNLIGGASACNSRGWTVGYLTTDGPYIDRMRNSRAVVWPSIDRKPIQIKGTQAFAINDYGQILTNNYPNSQYFLLTPRRAK